MKKEDIDFLLDLQHELKTQDNECCATPTFWGIMEDEELAVPEGTGDYVKACDAGSCSEYSLEELVERIEDELYDSSHDIKNAWCEVDKSRIADVAEFSNEHLKTDYEVIEFRNEYRICTDTGAFITKRAANKFIELSGHNYNKARTYGMCAYGNTELERLLDIIKNTDWKKMSDE